MRNERQRLFAPTVAAASPMERRAMTLVALALRNARRDPLRTLLTVAATMVAIATFIVLRTVVTSWQQGASYAQADRISTRNRMSFTLPLPRHYVDHVRATPGVMQATFMTYFNGKAPRFPDRFFVNFAAEPSSFLEVYDEISLPPEQKRAWLADRRGAIVGDVLARQLGLSLGDRLTLRGTTYPGEWTVRIAGVYRSTRKSFNASSLVFHWDYLNEALPNDLRDQVTLVNARVDARSRGADVSAAIDRTFESFGTPTSTLSERAASLSSMGLFSAALDALHLVAIIILAILGLILANTTMMSARERVREHALLCALGFAPRHLRALLMIESSMLGACASALGLALAFPLAHGVIARAVEESMAGLFPVFRIEPTTALLALLIAPALGAAAAALSLRRVDTTRLADALRAVD